MLIHIAFDFDGVIANSNPLKTNSFSETFRFFNLAKKKEFINYHICNGGISAKKKIEFYKFKIIKDNNMQIEPILKKFRELVSINLKKCPFDRFFLNYEFSKHFVFHIVSAGNKDEIVSFLKYNKIYNKFNGKILGGNKNKVENLNWIKNSIKNKKLIYLGDSKNDYISALKTNVDFCFIFHWTEFEDWNTWVYDNKIAHSRNLETYFDSKYSSVNYK